MASSGVSSHHSCPARCGELGARAVAEADAPRAAAEVLDLEAERRDRDGLVGLAGEDLELGLRVGLEGPVAVEVVGREVDQHRRLGRERLRVLELEGRDLADDGRVRGEAARERRQRRADVPRDRDRQPGLAVDVADQLGRGRLAVGPGDGDELVREQAPAHLDLPEHGDAALAGRHDQAGLLGARRGSSRRRAHRGAARRPARPSARSRRRPRAALSPRPGRCRSRSRSRSRRGRAAPAPRRRPSGRGRRRRTGRAGAAGEGSRGPFKRPGRRGRAFRARRDVDSAVTPAS